MLIHSTYLQLAALTVLTNSQYASLREGSISNVYTDLAKQVTSWSDLTKDLPQETCLRGISCGLSPTLPQF